MNESFAQAAGRHLLDAKKLHRSKRYDNAVYLLGYVVECTYKALVKVYIGDDSPRKFGHDISKLDGEAMDRLSTLFPVLELALPKSKILGTEIANKHPDRRYFRNHFWTKLQSKKCLGSAEEIYLEVVPNLFLDGKIGLGDI